MSDSLVAFLNSILPTPLHVCTDDDLLKFVQNLQEQDIRRIIENIVKYHEAKSALAPKGTAVIDGHIQPVSENAIKNALMYSEAVLVPDPLMNHRFALDIIAPQNWCVSKFSPPRNEIVSEFFEALRFHRLFRDAIAAGLVIPTPHHALTAAAEKNDHWFGGGENSSVYPERTPLSEGERSIIHKAARVQAAKLGADGLTILPHSPRDASAIAIQFDGDPQEMKIAYEIHMDILSHSPHPDGGLWVEVGERPCRTDESYAAWLSSSLEKRGSHRVMSLQSDIAVAQAVEGRVITPSPVNWELLKLLVPNRGLTPEDALLNMNLPYLHSVSVSDIVHARKSDDMFSSFRRGFRKSINDYCNAPADAPLDAEFTQYCEDYINDGLQEISNKYRALRISSATDIVVSTAVIVASAALLPIGGLAWALQIAASLGELKSVGEHIARFREIQSKPMFMLWSLTRKPFRAR